MTTKTPFLTDIKEIRKRARKHMENGAVTESYACNSAQVVTLLNQVLATEIVCTLRYKNHYYLASGIDSPAVKEEFLEHANDELNHANMVSERIVQLNGEPDWSPQGLLANSHSEYVKGTSLKQMLEENLVAERIAIDTYREIIIWLGNNDPTTRRVLEKILEQEEEHAEDLATLLQEK